MKSMQSSYFEGAGFKSVISFAVTGRIFKKIRFKIFALHIKRRKLMRSYMHTISHTKGGNRNILSTKKNTNTLNTILWQWFPFF